MQTTLRLDRGHGARRPRLGSPSRLVALGALALLLAAHAPLSAQAAGTVAGAVLNGLTGQPVRGATLTVEGTETSVSTDLDGLFRLSLPAGSYSVLVEEAGFATQRVTGVTVAAGEAGNLSVVLMPTSGSASAEEATEAGFGEEIVVTATADSSTEAALLVERKGVAQISDAIGAEEIGKNTGSDAAGVLRRVTGVSLQDDKFVYVRGLGDRYSNTTLNGSRIPSTEFEKKVVPLDLFPADLIEKITVSKSYTVDKPGDFAAGFVELLTREFPAEQRAAIGASVGFNGETTGDPYLEFGDGLDFFGDGGEPLPKGFPDEAVIRFSRFTGEGLQPEELERLGELIAQGTWSPDREDSAPVNRSFKGSYGNTIGRLGLVLSANYENDFSTRDEERNIFRTSASGEVSPLNEYEFDVTDEKVREALTGNLAYRFGDNHQLKLRSLLTQLATTESRFQEGFFSDLSDFIEDFRVSYREQEIGANQLSGEHFFSTVLDGGLVEWKISDSTATTEENRRQTLYEETTRDVFVLTDNAQSGFLFFNDLEDDLVDAQLDWTGFLNLGGASGSIKVGVAARDSERDFDGRRLRFSHRITRDLDLTRPPEELFIPENIDPDTFQLEEVTRPTDTYDGNHEVLAGYVQGDFTWDRFRVIGGLRVEDSEQEVVTADRFSATAEPIVTRIFETDFLPSLSLLYQLTPDTNLRFSASRTLNHPEYRELAPFRFTHVVGGFAVTGNPDLENADITSFDARWEWFPASGEVVAASLFFKDFDQPIESILLAGAELLESFANAESAENFGFELEFKRNLGFVSDELAPWTAIVNYTFVESEIDIDPDVSALTNLSRPLVGQPDHVLNTILEWDRPAWSSSARLLVNWVDDKVSRAGAFGLPDVIEEGRTTVDVVWRQGLERWVDGLAARVSASNLTGEEWLWTQGGGVFRVFEPGRSVSASVSYEFLH